MRRTAALLVAAVAALGDAARAGEGYFDSGGVRIHYLDRGEGTPVLLIHGLTSNYTANWILPGILDGLASQYRVLALDCRGHGKSDKPEDPEAYGIKLVEDAVALLDHAGVDRAHVAGYSMGGLIAMKLAATRPDRVRSAVIGGMGWSRPRERPGAAESFESSRFRSRALWACAASLSDLAIERQELLAIRVPMIVIHGRNDPIIVLGGVRPLRQARPDIPVVVVEGANHLSCVGRPEFFQAMKAFFDER